MQNYFRTYRHPSETDIFGVVGNQRIPTKGSSFNANASLFRLLHKIPFENHAMRPIPHHSKLTQRRNQGEATMTRRLCLFLLWAMSLSNAIATRHSTGTEPEEHNVDATKTYDANFMQEITSACRPEKDGYFGSTYGEATRFQYGFRIETEPLSSIMDMLDLVEDKIVDAVLSKSFPETCGSTSRRQLASSESIRASGFRFLKIIEKGKLITHHYLKGGIQHSISHHSISPLPL
jgi:hypothetical protein